MPRATTAIRPPARPSNGAVELRHALGDSARVVRRSPLPRQYKKVINWGNAQPLQTPGPVRLLNKPGAISKAVNKLIAFEAMKAGGVAIPEFATTIPAQRDGIWLARSKLSGSGGEGITVVRVGEDSPTVPLYVKYVKKVQEFRVHVVNGKAIFLQEKRRRNGVEMDRDQVLLRNYDNGWVFTINNIDHDNPNIAALKEEAIKAVSVLGLDFGAVDCILEKRTNSPIILEVNCAPGLQSPSLLEAYKVAFNEALTNAI